MRLEYPQDDAVRGLSQRDLYLHCSGLIRGTSIQTGTYAGMWLGTAVLLFPNHWLFPNPIQIGNTIYRLVTMG